MNDTTPTQPPAELTAALGHLGLTDLLDGYIDPKRVRARGYHGVEFLARRNGYTLKHEGGNIYGKLKLEPISLKLEPISTAPSPHLRIVTRSDVAAVHGSRRAA